jgi:uncharacterized membrane protein
MRTTLLIHIIAGGLGLLSGYVALAVSKGGTLHRRIGMLFVYVMTTMSITGMLISAAGGVAPAINIPLAFLTFYLVITSLLTVKTPGAVPPWLNVAGMVVAFGIALACLVLSVQAIAGGGARAGVSYVLMPFGGVAAAAGLGDRRMIQAGALRGAPRLKRHLWRMCFALFVASIAFYGAGRVPEMVRSPAVTAGGLLLPIIAMSYWLWRLRARHAARGMARVHTSLTTATEATK